MEGEERGLEEDESHQNSQTESDTDENNRQEDHSQTPPW